MRRFALAFLSLFVLAIANTGATATVDATSPCIASQVDVATAPEPSQVSGGPLYTVRVSAAISYLSPCRSAMVEANGEFAAHPLYVVERRDPSNGLYLPIRSYAPAVKYDGSGRPITRWSVVGVSLPQGSYRVRSYDGTELIESIPFAVGTIARDFSSAAPSAEAIPDDDRRMLAYGQASAILRSGKVYYRGFNPQGKSGLGYLSQDRVDGTTAIVPAEFLQLDPSDGDYFANAMGFSGDLTWTRVNPLSSVGVGTFDAGLPIVGCVYTSGGKACFKVFDPTAPFHDFNPNAAPFGAR